jgi:hypothetical protein
MEVNGSAGGFGTTSSFLSRGGSSFVKKGSIVGAQEKVDGNGKMVLKPVNTMRNGDEKLMLNEGSNSLLKK